MTKEMVVWMMEDQHLNVQDHLVFIPFTTVSKNSANINPIGHKTHGFLHCAVSKVFTEKKFLNFNFENFFRINFFLDENDEWKLGNLIQFATSRKGPVSPWYKDKAEKPQCCPVDGIATSDSTR